jgi:hypothetical protein
LPVTVAVKVTGAPAGDGFGLAARLVDVDAAEGVDGDVETRMYPLAVFVLLPPGPVTVRLTVYVPAAA